MSLWYLFFLTCASPPDRTPRIQCRLIRDVSARNALSKFDMTISKKYADKPAGFSKEEYQRLEQLNVLFRFSDDIVPLDDGEEVESMRTRGQKQWIVFSFARAWAVVLGTCTDRMWIGDRRA
jgi:hypothetical protein